MLKFEIPDVLFMRATKKSYEMEGRKGFYYYADVMIEGVVYRFKVANDDLYEIYKDTIEERGTLHFEIRARNNVVVAYLVKFGV